MTTYALRDIRPNPFRNVAAYPISRDKVDRLKESIGRTDFWDNLVARIGADGQPEIGYGHHRMVALREMFPPDHEISLIVRDLDDAAMLHVMADENMQEWASDIGVQKETVRAVRDFLVGANPKVSTGGRPPENGSTDDIQRFLGWPGWRVKECVGLLLAEEAQEIKPEDTAGLALDTAAVLRRNIVRIKDPVVRRQAVTQVRAKLDRGEIGSRGIADVVREVRQAASPAPAPKVPSKIAAGIYADIDNFWRVGINVNGNTVSRSEIIRLIAENRNVDELQGLAKPWADQIAGALDEMATTAQAMAELLRAESAVEVAS